MGLVNNRQHQMQAEVQEREAAVSQNLADHQHLASLELETAGNVRIEVATASDCADGSWAAACTDFVQKSFERQLGSVAANLGIGSDAVEITRVGKVHNAHLWAQWEDSGEYDDAGDPRPFEYVLWAPEGVPEQDGSTAAGAAGTDVSGLPAAAAARARARTAHVLEHGFLQDLASSRCACRTLS